MYTGLDYPRQKTRPTACDAWSPYPRESLAPDIGLTLKPLSRSTAAASSVEPGDTRSTREGRASINIGNDGAGSRPRLRATPRQT
jgi:hypothetical protein